MEIQTKYELSGGVTRYLSRHLSRKTEMFVSRWQEYVQINTNSKVQSIFNQHFSQRHLLYELLL